MENDLPVVALDGLKITPEDAIRILLAFIDEVKHKQVVLEGRIKEVAFEHNKLVLYVEQLAKIQGLEYSQDVKQWISSEKLNELKNNPR